MTDKLDTTYCCYCLKQPDEDEGMLICYIFKSNIDYKA